MSSSVAVAAAPLQFHDYLQFPINDTKPPIPDFSKYRNLRGKSVCAESRKTFEVYADPPSEGAHLAEGDCYPRLDSPTLVPRTVRRRSRSVTSLLTLSRERKLIAPVVPALPSPSVSVSVGNRGVEFLKGLAESVTGVIGSLSPRIAASADNDNGPNRHRQDSLCSVPSIIRSPVPSVLVSPCAQSFAGVSGNLNLASAESQTAPSPAVPPGPSSPLASPLYVLTPKTTNIPPFLSNLASKPLPLRSPNLNQEFSRSTAHLTGRDRSRSRSPSPSRSRSRSRPRRPDLFKPLPPTYAFDLPAPESPILRTVPSASDIARFKRRNLHALRINTETAERAAKIEREDLEREEDEAERLADEVARLEAETDRILAEQKKRDLARRRAQLPTPSPKFPRFLVLDKFSFLYRSRRSNALTSQAGTPSPGAPTIFSLDLSRPSSPEESSSPGKMSFIEQGGKGIVPGTDAPTSASNGGERRVCVRCLSSVINLPVNTDTSPVDILYSTANLTSHDIDPKASVLIECYVELGLERRLRRYERIRDVMNSWDRDQQNSLLVVTNDISQSDDPDLDMKSVPRTPTPPPGFTLQMYHSSRPGKWNKRWITLLESGQMFASKKPDSKASDKDSTVLCHLSDFDIYTPRESEARRHLKAPRRFCYAVKSQQKTFVFPNGENFVHFFCAEDGKLARRFLELVQRWRSWYLVNKQVDFEKKDKPPQLAMHLENDTAPKAISRSKSSAAYKGHSTQVSVDETPYTIGAFQPLLDMDRFDKPLEEFGKDLEQDKTKHGDPDTEFKSGLVRKATCKQPNVLTKSKSIHHKYRSPPTPRDEAQFSSTGLLGQGYEEKRKIAERAPIISPPPTNAAFTKGASLLGQGYEQKRKISERAPVNNSVPSTNAGFTEGPSLLNGGVVSPTSPNENMADSKSWFPLGADQSSQPRYRSRSVRDPNRRPTTSEKVPDIPQPLVNLTNSFPEPPRWRENKGHGVKAPAGGPLISLATGGSTNNSFNTRSASGLVGQSRPLPSSSSMTVGSRPRSRSIAGTQQSPSHAPPVPPLPIRSLRRENTAPLEQSRGRDPRPREPLINRAGTMGFSSRN